MIALLAALAGGLGAAARFLLDTLVARHNPLGVPLGTIVVNVTSCLLLGLLTGWAIAHPAGTAVTTVLGVGLLGGYSTFSTATVEGVRLLRGGDAWAALVHTGGMLALSLAASTLGLLVAA
ncbi:CrcB family protein [Georgenia sp. TF02-10]|uniref:fluoride efflux transporter FluC n=1 Tax=Georgenia sp. TF02-10 TaxID=2917725 RepID=UPI001FA7D9E6|nr:CrcB family protein [Georgenia sp. TF02-10]UNX54712.1 CrcB family protein [Georgenia sp. TF02-10]